MIKTSKLLSVMVVAALAWTGTACDRNLTSINTNPNGPVSVAPPSILPDAIQSAASNIWGTFQGIKMGLVWDQQVSEIQYPDEDRYIIRPNSTSGMWGLYSGGLVNAQAIVDQGVSTKTPNWEAVGLIMKSWMFGILTDYMGDIPYSQALKGATNVAPAYDKQQAVYTGIFADLAKAGQEIAPSGLGFPTGDLIYGGDMTKWKKFAYSLMLRDAIHLSKADPTTGAKEAQAAIAGGVFQSNDDNATLNYTAANPNPIYSDHWIGGRDDYGMSATLVDTLKALNDPRLPIYAQPTPADPTVYAGRPPGLISGPPNANVSRIGALWREQPNAPIVWESYAEVLFIEAEAAQRGWIAGSPASLYAQAITASMQQYGIPQAQIDAYLAQPRVQFNPATALTQIALQKWIALFMNGEEGFTEVRRTGVPHLVPGPDARLAAIPLRIPYPDDEAKLNATSYDAAMTAQGLSPTASYLVTMAQPVWWDK